MAVAGVAKAIRRSRTGISDSRRPIGSFIFLGPTGVGKTELARVLSEEMFNDRDALIKIDMSEFMEKHNVARLVGAPAGYVGYDDGGRGGKDRYGERSIQGIQQPSTIQQLEDFTASREPAA